MHGLVNDSGTKEEGELANNRSRYKVRFFPFPRALKLTRRFQSSVVPSMLEVASMVDWGLTLTEVTPYL